MAIIVNEEKGIFALETQNSLYQMQIGKFGHLFHMYYGEKMVPQDLSYLLFDGQANFTPYPYESNNRSDSLDFLPQEYPTSGTGDLRSVALDIENEDGTHVVDLRFKTFELMSGKYRLESLPSFFAKADEKVETLKIILFDKISNIEVELYYGVFEDRDVITRASRITNLGTASITIRKAQSLTLDFHTGQFDLIHFHGKWAMERQFERLPIRHSTHCFGSNHGVSSNRQNPGFIIADKNTTETSGACYGFNLVYSGNFTATAEQSSLELSRITLGLGDSTFSWRLVTGDAFETPEAILSYSSQGFERISQNFHDVIRQNLSRSKFTNTSRPVLINNWEATYFDFTGEKLLDIAQSATEIGVDLLVMDDGWFANRFDDNRSLGDWYVNEEKLGMPLKDFVHKINDLGLKFGLWIEPEMVSEESELYRAHPEWALNFPHRKPLMGRNQLVLDMSKPEVIEYLFDCLTSIFDQANIEYVKWDMNRPITDWFSKDLVNGRQGELQHRYILGLYDLLERLTSRYPNVCFEGCASGGARFDLGMLYYQPQIWTSDNTDAINRLKIQYGTSFFYPISSMGAHVAVSPSHSNGRITTLKTRALTAAVGTFGYELDLTKMTNDEKAEALDYTKAYKAYQKLIFSGDYYRLENPFDTECSSWQIVSKDKSESLLTFVATNVTGYPPAFYLKAKGLDKSALYLVEGQEYYGSVLMNIGIKLPKLTGVYPSVQYYIKKSKRAGKKQL
ncbi:alpha-galactosidase [Lactococcus ileimucosae]|uniref:alpha-galactosidase n=1 Tax=Lactococcus ileimucosae TaxID=2941329 RepID=UPI003516F7E5